MQPTQKTKEETNSLFESEGYLVIRGALEPRQDLEPLATAFSTLVDQLLEHVLGDRYKAFQGSARDMSFPERFACLVGLTNGRVFHHIDPTLNIYERTYQRWRHAPSAQLPELFQIMRNPKLLDLLDPIIGSEIWATPVYHVNIKLTQSQRQIAREAASGALLAEDLPRARYRASMFMHNFQLEQTPWHVDGYPGLGNESKANYVNLWVPLTRSGPETGGLVVLPRSHQDGYGPFPCHRAAEAVTLNTAPGDVVLMDCRLFHSSAPNHSARSHRWAFNMRYMPLGDRCGRPYLPGFVARSRKNPELELRDSAKWQQNWMSALDFLDQYEPPLPHPFRLNGLQIKRLEHYWRKLVPDEDSWHQLPLHGTTWRAFKSAALWRIDRIRAWLEERRSRQRQI